MIENPQTPAARHPEADPPAPAESKTLALHPAFYVLCVSRLFDGLSLRMGEGTCD